MLSLTQRHKLLAILVPEILIFLLLAGSLSLAEDLVTGRTISNLSVKSDGPLVGISLEDVLKLIELGEGTPYKTSNAKSSIHRLYSTQLFHDVQIDAVPMDARQVSVEIILIRKHLIDEVEFKGELQFSRWQLRQGMAFREGEPYSAALLEEWVSRLKEFHQNHGFYQVSVQSEFEVHRERARLKLTIEIDAGEKASMGQLDFQVGGDLSPGELQTLMKLRSGEPFSQLRLDSDIRAIRLQLAMKGFLRAYVQGTTQYDPQTNSVELDVRIVPKDRTEILWEGIDPDPQELDDLPLFNRRGSTQSALEETASLLRERYQQEGYFLAAVKYLTLGSDRSPSKIIIRSTKGRKHRVREIKFEGNQFAEDGSLRQIVSVRESGLFGRGEFSTEMALADVQRIRSYYQARGYENAKVSYEVSPDSRNEDLSLIYRVTEGQRTYIETIEFSGNTYLSREILFQEIEGRAGHPLRPVLITQDRNSIVAAYEDLGYREVDVRSDLIYLQPYLARLTYFIDEGPKFFVEHVIVTGNLATKQSSIRQEVRIPEGGPLSLGQLLQTETNLYNLGVFTRVQVREASSYRNPLHKNVLVSTKKGEKHTLLYGIGYSSFEGPRGTLGVSNRNFSGRAHTLSSGLRVGAKRQRANVSYSLPRVFGRKLPSVISLTGTREESLTQTVGEGGKAPRGKPFDEFRLVLSAQTERQLSRRESLFFRYNFENVEIDLPPELAAPLEFFREEEKTRLSSLALSYLNESRDDPVNPRIGFFLSGDARLATRAIGSEEDFFRILAQGQHYHKLFPDLVLASSLRVGGIFSFGPQETEAENPVPISERLFSGGSTTLRGLPQDLAGPLLTDPETGEILLVNDRGGKDPNGRPVPLGGNALLIANLELRFPLVSFLSGSIFYDMGNVFRSFSDLSAGFSNAVGIGVRFNTPVGPIRFDIGYNPDPPDAPGFNRWNFHVNLGQPF